MVDPVIEFQFLEQAPVARLLAQDWILDENAQVRNVRITALECRLMPVHGRVVVPSKRERPGDNLRRHMLGC